MSSFYPAKGRESYKISLPLFVLVLFGLFLPSSAFSENNPLGNVKNWCILLDYQKPLTSEEISRVNIFEMAIFDPDSHPPLENFKNKLVLIAYLSLGETGEYRFYWDKIKDKNWVLGINPQWQGRYVDVRSPEWQNLILDEIIPKIIEKGFRGLMLDTLDTAGFLEDNFGQKFSGEKEAMVRLVKSIRERYPKLLLISNNGFSVLEEISGYLSAFLAEDIFMMIDFKRDAYIEVSKEDREFKVNLLKKLSRKHGLPVFVIDYLKSGNLIRVAKLRRKLEKLGFRPYIAEKNLDQIYAQP